MLNPFYNIFPGWWTYRFSFKSTYGGGTTFEIKIKQRIVNNEPIGKYIPVTEEEKIEFIDYSTKEIVVYAED